MIAKAAHHAHAVPAMSEPFSLHERLERGAADCGVHGICRVLLKDQAHFPWVLLVPQVAGEIREVHDLSVTEYASVCESIRHFSRRMAEWPGVEKVNVAAIGNQVVQLHIHIVGRHSGDIAWPSVVWSCAEKQAYAAEDWQAAVARVRAWVE
jgi:diadenosine tetraphosphate (Ap4A) HIT family hydrolase